MKVFNELRNLYQEKEQNNLVIFVGAGISENYANIKDGKKFPSWKTLVESLVPEDMDKTSIIDSLKIAQILKENMKIVLGLVTNLSKLILNYII